MNLKYAILPFLAAVAAYASAEEQKEEPKDSVGFQFTDVTLVKTTPVTNQNKSGTCWCFSTNTFMEDEILRKGGKEVDLSEMYVVRKCYEDKAKKYIRMEGKINFAQGGSTLDVPYVWRRYGMMPEEAYKGLNYGTEKHDHAELSRVLTAYCNAVNSGKPLTKAWFAGLQGILDAYFGPVPETFTIDGKTYTPESYAKSLGLDMDDYVAFTSFTHHPFYTDFAVEVADNWIWEKYRNVPIDELEAIVDNAIENGYPVAWAADVSEGGFKYKEGFAVMPVEKDEKDMEGTELARWVKLTAAEKNKERFDIKGPCEEMEITQEKRQEMFDNRETTDDHGMVIVGIAKDQNGNKYYKVQNSWDTNQVYGGFFYVSVPYFKAKTMDIVVNKNAVPKAIAKKVKL